ncbi:magnesium transporter [Pendulispora brunnea]|uniref:Magnesium transporter MgtE n=1 Tax=Pendulispora brunnea TaxID=2905690 RepID=A0ABZ2KST6_9BACT
MPEQTSDLQDGLTLDELRDVWVVLSGSERQEGFHLLPKMDAEDFFLGLPALDMSELVLSLPPEERRSWVRLAPPDDVADLVQASPPEQREHLLALLDDPTRKEVAALLAYREDVAGGLMNPRYARVRPNLTVDEALVYLRNQARAHLGTIYYVYVMDDAQRLVGVVSLKQLFAAPPEKTVRDVMRTDLVQVGEQTDQEAVGQLFAEHDLLAIPVVDAEGRMKGLVTVDDIVDVVQEEATEDAQKFGGMESLDAPYLKIAFFRMVKKRGGWLAALFLGEMLTATAMAHFEDQIARAVVLALFVPLIISSGGNSGSQASTLVIRAMAVGEVRLRDWWRVMRRELASGIVLGLALGCIGFLRIFLWQQVAPTYGEHYLLVAFTVFLSLIGVVTFGTLAGSLLPFVLRRLGFDPASASAPFVATLVDVTGLIIYFSVAAVILRGALL